MSLETFGSYQLIKRLATGGMAQIYLARQTGLEGFEKLLVVKRILPHLAENEEFVKMFLDEARIAARLNHPNVVQIFNLGQQDTSFFIAMEYIHGEDVRRLWKRADQLGQEFPIPLVLRVVMDACAGLDYAHKKTDTGGRPLNIVHRDISPQNILVTFDGGVKVVDFGIAKAADQATVTRSGVLKGKYSYMSPEQAAGKKIDCRSDVFALGVVLYELLTASRLFKRQSDLQTLKAVTECNVTPPSQANPRVPADLDEIVLKALARDPDRRYQEAVQLQLALEDWLIRHQLPSSSAHLAQFMQQLYAERLEREAREGKVLIEELESLPPQEGSPNSPPRRRPTGKSSPQLTVPVENSDNESTTSDRPRSRAGATRIAPDEGRTISEDLPPRKLTLAQTPRSISARKVKPGELSLSVTLAARRGVPRSVWWLIALLVIGGAGFLGFPYLRLFMQRIARINLGGPAVVRVRSVPAGAKVIFDGAPLPTPTPCTLPSRPAGSYPLALELPGHQRYDMTVVVPGHGELELPEIRLDPAEQKVETPPQPVVDRAPDTHSSNEPPPDEHPGEVAGPGETHPAEHHSRPRAKVSLTLRTDPPGAHVFLDGEDEGVSPATVSVDSRATRTVRVELSGYRTLQRRLRVGQGPSQEETFPLKPAARPSGTVVFVINPWADVSCNGQELGQTPFPAKELPAGSYSCKFVNPDLKATQTRTVEVRPNERTLVKVNFPAHP